MTRTFTTPRFQTAFDRVVEPLALPGVLQSGEAPELTTVDQMVRGVAVVGRFIAPGALLGVKVRPTGRPVRVTVHLRFDSMSLAWWEQRITAPESVHAGAPRLFRVRAQGRTRAAVLLVRPSADFRRAADGVVSFDLQPGELTAEGLFVLELLSSDESRPEWAAAVQASVIGVMLDRIEFAEIEGDRELGLESTGTTPGPADELAMLRTGYFVVNPDGRDEPRRWIARATLVDPVVPGPLTKAPVVDPVPEPTPEPATAPMAQPVERRPKRSRGLKRKVKRRVRRAARWVVPVAAVPGAKRMSRRVAALERRIIGAAKRRATPEPAVVAAPVPPPAPVAPPAPPEPPVSPLADVMVDLVGRNLVQVELAGIEPGASTPGVQVRALDGAEIEIVTDGPLTVPAMVRLALDSSDLRGLPGLDDRTVRWDLVVRPEA